MCEREREGLSVKERGKTECVSEKEHVHVCDMHITKYKITAGEMSEWKSRM